MKAILERKRSYRSEREFGLIVGGMLLLLSGWWTYRGKFHSVNQIFLPLGALLVLLGIVWPRILFYPNQAWMTLAEGLSYVSTRVVLAFVYFVVLTPIGIIKRITGWDPLGRRAPSRESYWQPYSERQRDPRHYEKMF